MINKFRLLVAATASVAVLSADAAYAKSPAQKIEDAVTAFSYGAVEAWDEINGRSFLESKSWVSAEVLEENNDFRVAGNGWARVVEPSEMDMSLFMIATEPDFIREWISEAPGELKEPAAVISAAQMWAEELPGLPFEYENESFTSTYDMVRTLHALALEPDYPAYTDFQITAQIAVREAVERIATPLIPAPPVEVEDLRKPFDLSIKRDPYRPNPLDELASIETRAITIDPFGLKDPKSEMQGPDIE